MYTIMTILKLNIPGIGTYIGDINWFHKFYSNMSPHRLGTHGP